MHVVGAALSLSHKILVDRLLHPGTPSMKESSSLGARRRLSQDATHTTFRVLVSA